MKKLMMALAIVGLAFSAAACNEDPAPCPKDPIAFQMIKDLETVSALPATTLAECATFADQIATVSDKYASQYDAAKSEAESLKDTSAACKAKLTIYGILNGLGLPDIYNKLSESGESCKTILVGDENSAQLEKMNGALTTTAGWKSILQTAADSID